MTELKRLYQVFEPEHYDLYIDVNRETKTISGTTTVTGTAKETKIGLHQKDLAVSSVKVAGSEVDFSVNKEKDLVEFDVPKTGEVVVEVSYTAPLTDTMMGIYPSYYEHDGVKKQLVGTQFETNFARQAFLCVDEPEAKATFKLALKFDEKPGEIALSNMPETHIEDGVHYFDKTVKMSTYLVAFAFGEMQSKLTETKSGVKVGVFSTKAHKDNELDFALDIAKRAIDFYEDFYQTPYPLPHSWQLGLPDFSAGAMENWGLVTYREAYLLLDPDNTALSMKQVVATVIAHELAHQWFGDLVTMKWWDDLWLNESFANMMEYVAIDAIQPDWHIWESFQTGEAPAALQRDATDGVQSVHVQVEHPAEVDSLFDPAIVYAKGARLLVMVRSLIGDDALRQGLKNYFKAHQYNNATGPDLWKSLGEASGMDVSAVMDSWLEQPGYPVVKAEIVDGELQLSQQQFFIGEGQDIDRKWQIPLNANYKELPELFTEKTVSLGNYAELRQANGKALRLNVGNNSHFIVQYDQQLLDDILSEVDELDSIAQLQLLQDLRLLSDGRRISYAQLVPMLKNFADSTSNIVNAGLYRVANNLKRFVKDGTDAKKDLQALLNKLSHKQFERLGFTPKADESNDDQLTRPYILSAALYAKNEHAMTAAHQLFEQHQDDLLTLPAEVRSFVLSNEVKNYGSKELFKNLLTQYQKSTDASYKRDLTAALVATSDKEFITELISKFEDSDVIKPQDLRSWFSGLLSNDKAQEQTWDWLRSDWQWLEDTVGGDMEFTSYITVVSNIFKDAKRLEEFKAFFEPKINTPGLTREIKMGIKSIESRVDLIESETTAVEQALSAEK